MIQKEAEFGTKKESYAKDWHERVFIELKLWQRNMGLDRKIEVLKKQNEIF